VDFLWWSLLPWPIIKVQTVTVDLLCATGGWLHTSWFMPGFFWTLMRQIFVGKRFSMVLVCWVRLTQVIRSPLFWSNLEVLCFDQTHYMLVIFIFYKFGHKAFPWFLSQLHKFGQIVSILHSFHSSTIIIFVVEILNCRTQMAFCMVWLLRLSIIVLFNGEFTIYL
jgi:hypothetical protein